MSYAELTQFQYDSLMRAANGDSIVFAVLKPADRDTAEQRGVFELQLKEMNELIGHGLLTDVSDRFQEPIQISKLNHGREFLVLALTDTAVEMFRDSALRSIN